MAQRAERLNQLLTKTKQASDQAHRARLKAEEVLSAIEARESRESARGKADVGEMAKRYPALRERQ